MRVWVEKAKKKTRGLPHSLRGNGTSQFWTEPSPPFWVLNTGLPVVTSPHFGQESVTRLDMDISAPLATSAALANLYGLVLC